MKTIQHKNATKRNIFILLTCCFLVIGGVIFVSADTSPLAGKDSQTVGKMIGEALKSVLQANEAPFASPESNPDRIVGEFYGENVTAREMDYRAAFYEISGSTDPLKDSLESFITEKYIYNFAKLHGLLPSENEVREFCQSQRAQVESASGGNEYVQSVTEAMGMTPDEYWNDYKVKYEAPSQLTDSKVAVYWQENKIKEPTREEILSPYLNVSIEDEILLKKYNK